MDDLTDARLQPSWPSRAIVSGFAASGVMLLAFILAYLAAQWLASLELTERLGGSLLRAWLHNLTANPVISLTSNNLYIAAGLFLAGGLLWAYVYAALAEPNLSGPAWRRGALYALLPGLLALVVVLPILGGGLAGAALGAGPLPALGIVLLHLVYGSTLGLLYGPLGDSDDETWAGHHELRPQLQQSERLLALGVLGGALTGSLVGLLLVAIPPFATAARPAGLVLGTALLASALGALIGSFAGLAVKTNGRMPS